MPFMMPPWQCLCRFRILRYRSGILTEMAQVPRYEPNTQCGYSPLVFILQDTWVHRLRLNHYIATVAGPPILHTAFVVDKFLRFTAGYALRRVSIRRWRTAEEDVHTPTRCRPAIYLSSTCISIFWCPCCSNNLSITKSISVLMICCR